uniref:Uncharacterized protein n=1 Tax=Candidatus Kentrum eta TaxID=2126337 RepID=A0A450U7E6_9GAMM|nr:MAG: hypothetical protein BECKH772A_GA0070896_1000450 [Candidatus Kentron sp. H]VFJ89451.1 MAG: hypothetical protein BECKH772B_GA0070898_1000450 [Candidatus Kentron sp. H]
MMLPSFDHVSSLGMNRGMANLFRCFWKNNLHGSLHFFQPPNPNPNHQQPLAELVKHNLRSVRSCLEIRIVARRCSRLWLLQGAMGAKIRIVVDYTTQFSPPSQRSRTQFGRRRSRLTNSQTASKGLPD